MTITMPGPAMGLQLAAPSKNQVFISHSRHDEEGATFLLHAFNGSKFSPFFYSVRHPDPPHARPIRDSIRGSAALFVLLSEHVRDRDYTRAWVGYEVGVASAAESIPVVVVEPENSRIDIQVPGATHYVQRPTSAIGGLPKIWEFVAETACHLEPSKRAESDGTLGDNVLTFLYNASTADKDASGNFTRVTCKRDHCRATFWAPSRLYDSARLPCPSCRTPNASFMVGLQELSHSLGKGPAALPKK